MGMPLTSFVVMQALLQNLHEIDPQCTMRTENPFPRWLNDTFQEVNNSLRSFGLLAFILHSPGRHAELHRKLQTDFEILDRTTGHNLLFFTAIEPSEEWLRSAGGRHYLSKITSHYTSIARGLACPDSDATLCALTRAFSINTLPAIVVLDPKTPDDCAILQTSALEIEQQLGRLASCASDHPSQETPLRNRLSTWRLGEVLQWTARGKAIYRAALALTGVAADGTGLESREARNILKRKILKFSQINRNGAVQQNVAKDALETSDADLKEFQMELPSFYPDRPVWMDEPDPESTECAVGLLLDAAFYMASLSPQRPREFESSPSLLSGIDRKNLELEASGALASAQSILRAGAMMSDYSPLLICIAKAFESEMNASIIQWYRLQLGVNMPEFFKRHAPGVSAVVGSSYRPVDFNATRGAGVWHPPSLGQSLWVAVNHFSTCPEQLSEDQFESLLRLWQTFLPLRNSAAHAGLTHRQDYQESAQLWYFFKDSGLLATLLRLKTTLTT